MARCDRVQVPPRGQVAVPCAKLLLRKKGTKGKMNRIESNRTRMIPCARSRLKRQETKHRHLDHGWSIKDREIRLEMLSWDEEEPKQKASLANESGMGHQRLPVWAKVCEGHACFCSSPGPGGPFANCWSPSPPYTCLQSPSLPNYRIFPGEPDAIGAILQMRSGSQRQGPENVESRKPGGSLHQHCRRHWLSKLGAASLRRRIALVMALDGSDWLLAVLNRHRGSVLCYEYTARRQRRCKTHLLGRRGRHCHRLFFWPTYNTLGYLFH